MSKKILKGWINHGGGIFGWSENFNEHPLVDETHEFSNF
jgi:hypothetical protein